MKRRTAPTKARRRAWVERNTATFCRVRTRPYRVWVLRRYYCPEERR